MSSLARSLALLRAQVNASWPGRSKTLDGWIGDKAHASRISDHNPDAKGIVRALDVTATGSRAEQLIAATKDDPRVNYVIHNKRIWQKGKANVYRGASPHAGHVHISIHKTDQADFDISAWKGLKESSVMISPVEGYVTSEFGTRILGGRKVTHLGIDIGTGGKSVPVRAAFAGRVSHVVTNRVHGLTGNYGKPAVAPGRSGNGGRINNPDGETQVYIHVRFIVPNGAYVKAGQIIGYLDLSGNTTGYHLHFETWGSGGKARNPRIYFGYHSLKPGARYAAPSPRPITKPATAPAPAPTRPVVKNSTIQTRLKAMGYYGGNIDEHNGPVQKAAVKAYQKAQNKYGAAGLREDSDWGQITENWYQWVRKLQAALNAFKGSKIVVDGDYGSRTHKRVRELQKRNSLFEDGLAQTKVINFMRSHGSSVPHRP